jgi:hypothetical protein
MSRGPVWTAVGVPAHGGATSTPVVAIRPVPMTSTEPAPSREKSVTSSSRSSSPTGRPGWASGPGAPAFPRPSAVDQRSADAMALDGARAMASADTLVDTRPQHTAERAALAGWLTPGYGGAQLNASVGAAPGAQWDEWTRHRAYIVTSARLSGDDHPQDGPTTAARKVLLTEQAVGRDGWRDGRVSAVVAVVLKRVDGLWRIDDDRAS